MPVPGVARAATAAEPGSRLTAAPALGARLTAAPEPGGRIAASPVSGGRFAATPESGSQTTEYALVIVVAATVAALALAWARQGAVSSLFNAILKQVRGMFGIG